MSGAGELLIGAAIVVLIVLCISSVGAAGLGAVLGSAINNSLEPSGESPSMSYSTPAPIPGGMPIMCLDNQVKQPDGSCR